jgi:hypothetical protein
MRAWSLWAVDHSSDAEGSSSKDLVHGFALREFVDKLVQLANPLHKGTQRVLVQTELVDAIVIHHAHQPVQGRSDEHGVQVHALTLLCAAAMDSPQQLAH